MSGLNFPVDDIAHILISDPNLILNWDRLFTALIKGEVGKKLQLKKGFDSQFTTDFTLFTEILEIWMSQKGTEATIKRLIVVLEEKGFNLSAQGCKNYIQTETETDGSHTHTMTTTQTTELPETVAQQLQHHSLR